MEKALNEQPLLTARGVSKRYARGDQPVVDVLRSIDLEIFPGETIAIVGKSGTGKSTLLHILGTLDLPTSGDLTYRGEALSNRSEKELAAFRNRELGFVFQFHYLMQEFNALENVLMPALLAGLPTRAAKARAQVLLERVGLADRKTHKPNQLSGGEQQRVAVARALMMGPKLLLTDEMTGNLDPVTGVQVFDLVREIHAEAGMAIVSVTHDVQLAAAYSRVYRLNGGELRAEPPPGWQPGKPPPLSN